jgi:thiol-disulfide isomerase/thioredoxin
MTRRSCVSVLAALFAFSQRSRAASTLIPLDEAAFRRMVSEHRGKVLLVDFWATWCAPCREELPKLLALHATYQAKGFDFVTVSCDEPEQETQAAAFVTTQGAPGPHYIRKAEDDDKFINSMDPKWSGALPALFVFDRNGHHLGSFIGETDMKQLDVVLRKLLTR